MGELCFGHDLEILCIGRAGASEARAARHLLLRAAIEPVHAGATSPPRPMTSLSVILLQPFDLVVNRGATLDDRAVPAGMTDGR